MGGHALVDLTRLTKHLSAQPGNVLEIFSIAHTSSQECTFRTAPLQRAMAWERVLQDMLSKDLHVGSRTPTGMSKEVRSTLALLLVTIAGNYGPLNAAAASHLMLQPLLCTTPAWL
eukprot:scaffold219563_cov19-Tisochrysis_lutea.AAC.1